MNPSNTAHINKFNFNLKFFPPNYPNSYLINYSQTPQNGIKSFSFCNNNLPPANFIAINGNGNVNNNNLIPFDYKSNNITNQTNLNITNPNNNLNINNKISFHNSNIDVKYAPKDEPVDYKKNLENIINGKDKRTTIMLRNIPNKYTLSNLVEEVNTLFAGKMDYINLPIDYEVKQLWIIKFIYFLILQFLY